MVDPLVNVLPRVQVDDQSGHLLRLPCRHPGLVTTGRVASDRERMTEQYLAGEMAARPNEALQRRRQKCALELAGTRNTEAGLERQGVQS